MITFEIRNKAEKGRLGWERITYAVILLAFLCMSLIMAFLPEKSAPKKVEAPKEETRVTADGNTVLTEYFDGEGNPKKQSEGYYAILQEKDEAGHILKTTYLGSEKQPINISKGYGVVTCVYDAKGRKVSEWYFDVNGEPAISKSGYHGVLNHYEKGRNVMVTYLDKSGQPVISKSGYAILRRTYYEEEPYAGKVAYERYYDEKDEPVAISLGQCGVHNEYNEKGKLAAVTYLDADGKATKSSLGYATVKRTYYENGSLDTETYYDEEGNPIPLSLGQYGTKRVNGKMIYIDRKGREMFALRNHLFGHLISVIVAALLIAGLSLLLGKKGNAMLGVLFLFCIAYVTLFYREEGDPRSKIELFWSYRQFFSSASLRLEIVNNIWLFLPLGTILFRLLRRRRVMVIAVLISVGIELLQFVTGLGLAEFDDVLSNGLGGMLGTWLGYVMLPFGRQNANEKAGSR